MDALEIVHGVLSKHGFWVSSATGMSINKSAFHEIPASPENNLYIPAHLSTALLQAAKAASVNPNRDGPFAKEVRREYPRENWRGGKVDDIALVVAVAVQEGPTVKAKL